MKITQTRDIRTANRWEIFRQILHHYPISRVELSNITGLNKATVSTIVKEWMDLGLLSETERGVSASGRKPIMLCPQLHAGCVMAIDIDAGHVQAILTDLSGERILARQQFAISSPYFPSVYRQLCQVLDELLTQQPDSCYGLTGIGVSVHGIVDLSGMIRFVPRLGWRNIDLRALLGERYHVPVCIDNDGNLAAIAQNNIEMDSHSDSEGHSVSASHQSLAAVNISDSISAGLIVNGELLRGCHGFANAIGHHTINFDEPKQCHCGKYGCWEQYCSDTAVIAYANTLLSTPISTIGELVDLVRHQDAAAQKVLDEFIRHLAVGLTNIIFIFDCEVISISSEILSSLPYCLPEVMRSMILPITHAEKVVLSRLGKNGAILGAAGQAIEAFFQDLANTEPPAPSDT